MEAAIAAAASMEKQESESVTTGAASPPESDGAWADDLSSAEEGEAPDSDSSDGLGDDDGSETDGEDGGEVADYAALGQRIVDGDLAGACQALGIDPKILNVNVPKFEAMRKGLKETRARETAAVAAETAAKAAEERAQAIVADGKAKYGELVDLKLAVKAGDFYAVREILEALAPDGTPIQKILEGIALAAKNVNPSEIAYKRKLRELAVKEQADADAKKAKETADAAAASEVQRAERNKTGATKLLKGTELEDLPGAVDALVKLAAEHWDPVKKGLKKPPAELVKLLAKDPVLGRLLELKRLKSRQTPAVAVVPINKNRTRTPTGQFQRKPPTKAEQMAADRKAAIAEASRLEARDARAARRAK